MSQEFTRRHGWVVQGGPFAGMTYVRGVSCANTISRLLGSYEAELHPVVEQVISRSYPTVIDVGCAEGYYAIGLARRSPQLPGVRLRHQRRRPPAM